MAEEEAKLMGLTLSAHPDTYANPPRDVRAHYLYDSNAVEDWGSSVSEDDSDDNDNDNDSNIDTLEQFNLETGGLTDREIDRLDGKTSSRIGTSSGSAFTGNGNGNSSAKGPKYPERETGANTGPKGVLADQKYHKQQQLQERLSSRQSYNARLLAKAPTTTTYREDEAAAAAAAAAEDDDALNKLLNGENEDQDEKAVLERIRSNRLKDMKASWGAGAGTGGGLVGKKMFGSLMEMNAAQYVGAIDGEKKDVTVVIHIYSDFNPACKRLDDCLIQLAARYATTKFIRIKAREVDFDEEVCPTVLVYRAGDLIANLVMITYELSQEYDDKELEELLTKHKVISPHDQHQRETSFFENGLSMDDLSSLGSQFGDLNFGGGLTGGPRRGILSGNVPEFRYKDYEDDSDAEY
ncbi:Phosducin-like protein 2 [Podila epigama]|nr:Phosducin-like protein 2 [Podila epigama]